MQQALWYKMSKGKVKKNGDTVREKQRRCMNSNALKKRLRSCPTYNMSQPLCVKCVCECMCHSLGYL